MDQADQQDSTPRLVPQGFEDFYRAEWDSVYRPLAATIGDPHLAKDAAAEAMPRAFQRWSQVRTDPTPPGGVSRVGLTCARSRHRKQRREVLGDAALEPASGDIRIPDDNLPAALNSLSLDQRAVIVLRYYMDWSQDEVATALGIPLGTVKSRIHRALKKLEQEVEL